MAAALVRVETVRHNLRRHVPVQFQRDFYLQQLVNMYIHMHDIAEALHPYLVIGRNVFHLRPIGRRLYAVGSERWLRSVSDDSSFDVDVWRIGSSVP